MRVLATRAAQQQLIWHAGGNQSLFKLHLGEVWLGGRFGEEGESKQLVEQVKEKAPEAMNICMGKLSEGTECTEAEVENCFIVGCSRQYVSSAAEKYR